MSGQPGNAPLNFDSPSAAAALGGLGLDINLDNISVGGLVGNASRSDEDDRRKRMDAVIAALWVGSISLSLLIQAHVMFRRLTPAA